VVKYFPDGIFVFCANRTRVFPGLKVSKWQFFRQVPSEVHRDPSGYQLILFVLVGLKRLSFLTELTALSAKKSFTRVYKKFPENAVSSVSRQDFA